MPRSCSRGGAGSPRMERCSAPAGPQWLRGLFYLRASSRNRSPQAAGLIEHLLDERLQIVKIISDIGAEGLAHRREVHGLRQARIRKAVGVCQPRLERMREAVFRLLQRPLQKRSGPANAL